MADETRGKESEDRGREVLDLLLHPTILKIEGDPRPLIRVVLPNGNIRFERSEHRLDERGQAIREKETK